MNAKLAVAFLAAKKMHCLRGSYSTNETVIVTVSWVEVQLQEQHNFGGKNIAERRCFKDKAT